VRKIVGAAFREKKVQYALTGMSLAPGVSETNKFKVDSSIPEVTQLQGTIQDAFRRFGGGVQLATYSLQADAIRTVSVVSPKADSTGSTAEKKPATDDGSKKPAAENR